MALLAKTDKTNVSASEQANKVNLSRYTIVSGTYGHKAKDALFPFLKWLKDSHFRLGTNQLFTTESEDYNE